MQKIGILFNPQVEHTRQAGEQLAVWCNNNNLKTWVGSSQSGREAPDEVGSCDLLVALGGDGTVLRAARLAIVHKLPILGVALGHLNFMAEVRLEELHSSLLLLREGGGWYDHRTLIEGRVLRDSTEVMRDFALNEMLLARTEMARVVKVAVSVDAMPLTTYHADGVILSTATGSTAYALAAGGPLLDPRSDALLLVPIAGHLTHIPALVLPADAVVRWKLETSYPSALSVDGHHFQAIEYGDEIEIFRSQEQCRFARIHPRSHFYETLASRLRRE